MLSQRKRPLLRDVEHLPRLATRGALSIGEIGAALIAAHRRMLNTPIRDLDPVKPRTAMPFLPAPLLTRTLTQAPLLRINRRLRQPVR